MRPSLLAAGVAALAVFGASGALALGAPAERAATVPAFTLRSEARDLGRAAATRIDLTVGIPNRNDAQLDRLIEMQSDSASPLYHRYLSNEQFNAYFAPTPHDYAHVIQILQRLGFHVTQTFPNRAMVDVSAPSSLVERVFNTEIHQVAQNGAGIRYANVRPAYVPASLHGLVDIIDGFNNLLIERSQIRNIRHSAEHVLPQTIPLKGPHGGWSPIATSIGYDLPIEHGSDGTGRATGNAICGDFQDSDLSMFLAQFGIVRGGPATTRIDVDGGAPYYPPGHDPANCSIESSLDTDTIVGNAPGTAFYEYLMPELSDKSIEDVYTQVDSDNLVDVLNSSFGGCEVGDDSFDTMTNKLAGQGAVKGISFSASSGDAGSGICGSGNGASAPASGPQFLGIGGTILQLDSNGNYVGETAWNGSTGGYSVVFPEPKWQKIIANPLPNGRNTPDIAFASVGVAIVDGGNWETVDGTSWSSPIYCALQTEIDEELGGRAGHIHNQIYHIAKRKGYPPYHDITSGKNGLYSAGPGYDEVTGIGSADGELLSQSFKLKK